MSDFSPAQIAADAIGGWTDADYALDELTRSRLADGVPVNTQRAYEWAWSVFEKWCDEHGRRALPATPQTLADYVSDRMTAGWQPATIEHAVGAIRSRHGKAGHRGSPDTEQARLVLRGYRRALAEEGVGQRQAIPFTPTSLRRTLRSLDLDTPAGRRDQMLLVFGFQMMARRSELARLNVGDVAVTPDGVDISIRTSKTDHDSEGRVTSLVPQDDLLVDPVRLFVAWAGEVGPGPLFRRTNRRGELTDRLSANGINLVVKRVVERAGLPMADRYTAHSLRAGGLTAALRAGWPLGIAARHGGWNPESPTPARYARGADRFKDNAMKGVFR